MIRLATRLFVTAFAFFALEACDVVTRRETPTDPKPKAPESSKEDSSSPAALSVILSRIEVPASTVAAGGVMSVTVTVKDVNGTAYSSLTGVTCELAFGGGTSLGTLSAVTASGNVFLASVTGVVGGTASKLVGKINGTLLLNYQNITVQWEPTSDSGLQVWLKADSLTGVTNGQAVGTWSDSGTLANDATQSSGANQPTYVASAVNGKPALAFNGSTQYMTVADNAGLESTIVSVFAVAKYGAAAAGSTIAAKTTTGAWNDGWGLGDITGSGTGFGFFVNDKTTNKVTSSIGTGSYIYFGATYNKTDIRYYQNATIQGAPYAYTTNVNNPAAALHIGNHIGGAGYFTGEIAELIVYDVGVSNTTLLNLKNYINGKYGL